MIKKKRKARVEKPSTLKKNHPKQQPLNVQFFHSAAYDIDLPESVGQEFCLLGRSNVGKSSFINHVFGNRTLAYVSKKPGKTVLANFFRIDEEMIWVDLPGYGYAKASRSEKERCSSLIHNYCTKRKNLVGILWLLDIRHVGLPLDNEAFSWIHTLHIPIFPILTKRDKLPQNKQTKQIIEIERLYHFKPPTFSYSIHSVSSRERFWHQFLLWKNHIR